MNFEYAAAIYKATIQPRIKQKGKKRKSPPKIHAVSSVVILLPAKRETPPSRIAHVYVFAFVTMRDVIEEVSSTTRVVHVCIVVCKKKMTTYPCQKYSNKF